MYFDSDDELSSDSPSRGFALERLPVIVTLSSFICSSVCFKLFAATSDVSRMEASEVP